MSSRKLDECKLAPRKFPQEEAPYWVRNKAWPALYEPGASEDMVNGLYAVFPDESNWFSVRIINTGNAGTVNIDYGDGRTISYASNITVSEQFDFSNSNLYDATVSFVDAGDLVLRNAHGYANGEIVRFYRIQTTTGVVEDKDYYVINSKENSFQISENSYGPAVTLTNNGSAALLPYKIATVAITPSAGATFGYVQLATNHSLSTGNYRRGWLDVNVSASNANSNGGFGGNGLLERLKLVSYGTLGSAANLFQNSFSLQEFIIPYNLTAGVTSTQNMFGACYLLRRVPLFNTSSVTNSNQMFSNCYNLEEVPAYDLSNSTNYYFMFANCYKLRKAPWFDTSKNTSFSLMYTNCFTLEEVPEYDFSSATTISGFISGCNSLIKGPSFKNLPALTGNNAKPYGNNAALQEVALFNTSSATDVSSLFNNCQLLRYIPAYDFSSVTSSSGLSGIFNACYNLSDIDATGFKYSFSVINTNLSGAALDKLYTNLPTVTGQTITVSNTPGRFSDNPSIATAKGWTVVG